MAGLRLDLALGAGLSLPDDGRIVVLGARSGADLAALPRDRVVIEQRHFPDHQALERAGWQVETAVDGAAAAVLVVVPRARAEAEALVARAAAMTRGPVIVDGQKTDGIDTLLKALRGRVALGGPISKAHGKIAWFEGGADLSDWAAERAPSITGEGWVTAPGVFSADGPDPASVLLAETLPDKLGRAVADLGAGWGYLSARVLERADVETLDLVEGDAVALDCARANVTDPRARFHWADATAWGPARSRDAVVMNPPFHQGRKGDPGLGQAFIVNAARLLKPSGRLWMVANRHLPYEITLREHFAQVETRADEGGFKVIEALKPKGRR